MESCSGNMRIAIDISQIVYGTGVSAYTKNLVENLLKIDKEDKFILFAGSLRRRKDVLNIFPQTKVFPIPPTFADLIWNKFHVFPIEKLIGKVDVFHTSDWSEPPSKAFKITTVHDLYPLKFPRLVSPLIRQVHKRKLSWVFQESKRIIVPSESTKNDLLEVGVNENVIKVVPEAPTLSRTGIKEIELIKTKYKINGDYLVAIGITKLKNTERIIKAFHLARAGRDVKLLLIGNLVGVSLTQERNVRILGFVPQQNLAAILSGSIGLIFASLYEGFGIPILDAMNCGVPVVTSNLSSMAEVAGEAAALVDPEDINSITDGIEKILRGPKGYIGKGIKRVQDFSWEKTARMTLDVYNESRK